MKIIFENLDKLVLKIEIGFGREPKILSKMDIFEFCKEVNFCIMQYHNKYVFFEIFTILKSDCPKNYSKKQSFTRS